MAEIKKKIWLLLTCYWVQFADVPLLILYVVTSIVTSSVKVFSPKGSSPSCASCTRSTQICKLDVLVVYVFVLTSFCTTLYKKKLHTFLDTSLFLAEQCFDAVTCFAICRELQHSMTYAAHYATCQTLTLVSFHSRTIACSVIEMYQNDKASSLSTIM